MNFDVIFTIFFTSIIQSIFGTGVLLFGTPILLLIGYTFENILAILLPTSILINLFQIKDHYKNIDKKFYKNLILYCLPLIVITLYIANLTLFKANIFIGIFLIIISMQIYVNSIKKILKYFLKYEPQYLIIMGALHGLTNLGGTLLSGAILSKDLSKNSKRVTIAISYFSMALIQVATLIFLLNPEIFINRTYPLYWALGLIIFFIVEKYFYPSVNEKIYHKYSNIFLFTIGILLIFKN